MGEKLLDNKKTNFEKSDSRFGISAAPKKLNIVFLVQSKGKLKKKKEKYVFLNFKRINSNFR